MSMFDRLEDTLRRYEDVTAELGNPDIFVEKHLQPLQME